MEENDFITTHNQGVLGSSPSGTTLKIKDLHINVGLFLFIVYTICIQLSFIFPF